MSWTNKHKTEAQLKHEANVKGAIVQILNKCDTNVAFANEIMLLLKTMKEEKTISYPRGLGIGTLVYLLRKWSLESKKTANSIVRLNRGRGKTSSYTLYKYMLE